MKSSDDQSWSQNVIKIKNTQPELKITCWYIHSISPIVHVI